MSDCPRSSAPRSRSPALAAVSALAVGRVVRGVLLAGFLLWGACDFGTPAGEGQGCLRVHQGDYEFPVKRIIKSAVSARVTQPGMDLVTGRIEQLVQTFFEVDEAGRAILPLDVLGLGAIGTEVGPFDAELRDVVLSLDLSALQVELVAGSTPPRLRITVTDAVIGLESGEVAGGFEVFFIGGDAACGLADGPAGHVALLSFVMELTLATREDATLDVSVAVEAVDLQEVSLSVVTDCAISECTDGCGECELLCGAADLAAGLAGFLQGIFDGLVDTLATFLADQLADVVLDEVLNGRPLAVEGEIDVAGLGGLLLPYLRTARPVGVLARPAGDAFAIDGAGVASGLDVLLDAGMDAAPSHPCTGGAVIDPVFEAGAPPPWPPHLDDGSPYHVGVAVSGAVVNEAVWALWKSGVLCIDIDTDVIAELLGADATLRAATLDIMAPGLSSLAGRDAPVRARLRPALHDAFPVVRFDHPVTGAPIGLDLEDAVVSLEVMVGDHFLQVLAVEADLGLGLAVDALPGARLGLRLHGLAVDDLRVIRDEAVSGAQLDLVIPFVVDLLMGVLADQSIALDLDPGPLVEELLGLPLVPVISSVEPAGDWLRLLVTLVEAEPVPDAPTVEPTRMERSASARGELELDLPALPGHEVQLRVAGGGWGEWLEPGGVRRVTHPRLWLAQDVDISMRVRPAGGLPGPEFTVGRLPGPAMRPEAASAEGAEPSWRGVADQGTHSASGSGAADTAGCLGGRGSAPALPWLAWLAVIAVARPGLRRRMLALVMTAALGLSCGGCADDVVWPSTSCVGDDQCPEGYLCGPAGTCVVASGCDADGDCCPGAECTGGGWCRPTTECDPVRSCVGVDITCEAGRCVPAPCGGGLDACSSAHECVAGRCLPGEPCGEACGPGEACHVPSGRCVVAAGCDGGCPSGARAVVIRDAVVDPFQCVEALPCECVEVEVKTPSSPGHDPVLLPGADEPRVVSYDPVAGDLVLSRFPASPAPREDRVLDGALASDAGADEQGHGPDRGWRPAAALTVSSGQPQLHVWHQDRGTRQLRVLHASPATGGVEASYAVDVGGAAGRYSCLVEDPVSGRLLGWVFVEADPTQTFSSLVRLEASVHPPSTAGDWHAQTVVSEPLPPRDAAPCDAACGLGGVCARIGPGQDTCVPLLDAVAPCVPACDGPFDVCVPASVPGGAAVCAPRVLTAHGADRLPSGQGLFVDCAAAGDDVVVAWYDAERRSMAVVRGPGGVGAATWIAGAAAGEGAADRGRHVAVAGSPSGEVTVFFQDTTAGSLWAARQSGAGQPWTSAPVHEPESAGAMRDLGVWNEAIVGLSGRPLVAYGDAASGDVWLAARGPLGCWHRSVILSAGAWVTPSLAPSVSGGVWVVGRRLSAGGAGTGHGVAVLDVPTPAGACDEP